MNDAPILQNSMIPIARASICFTYTFFWESDRFQEVQNFITEKSSSGEQLGEHRFLGREDAFRLFSSHMDAVSDDYIWSLGRHPLRIGLSSLVRFGVPSREASPASASEDELSCFRRLRGPFEVMSGLGGLDASATRPDSSYPIVTVTPWLDVLFRLGDNGEGAVTIELSVDEKSVPTSLTDSSFSSFITTIHSQLGLMPFLFGALTLARLELPADEPSVPISLLRRSANSSDNSALSLHEFFDSFLDQGIRPALRTWFDGTDPFPSVDNQLRSPAPDAGDAHTSICVEGTTDLRRNIQALRRAAWQAPSVSIFLDLDSDRTLVDSGDDAPRPWWHWPIHTQADLAKYPGVSVQIEQRYRETVLLLLRLYQWRDVLRIDEIAQRVRSNSDASTLVPHWERVQVLPDLLQETDGGHVFQDVDLVWDSRYLMLTHERSSLILSCIDPSGTDRTMTSFRERFARSVIRSIEAVRAKWHALIALSLVLDSVVNTLSSTPSSIEDIPHLHRIASFRTAFARILRDPFTTGTDGAALSEVRSRAKSRYQIDALRTELQGKFDLIDQILADRSRIHNLRVQQQLRDEVGE